MLNFVYRAGRKLAGVSAFRYSYLYWYIRRRKVKNILEIGVYRGARSTGFVKASLKRLAPAEVNFYGIDLFEQFQEQAQDFLESEWAHVKPPLSRAEIRTGLERLLPAENIHLLMGLSDEVFAQYLEALPPMDFIFVDGGHSLETIASDFAACQKLLSSDGTLFLDDVWLTREEGARLLYESLAPHLWKKWLFPLPDFFPETVGAIWVAGVKKRTQLPTTRD